MILILYFGMMELKHDFSVCYVVVQNFLFKLIYSYLISVSCPQFFKMFHIAVFVLCSCWCQCFVTCLYFAKYLYELLVLCLKHALEDHRVSSIY